MTCTATDSQIWLSWVQAALPRSSRRTKLVVRADGFIGSANNLVSPAYMRRDILTPNCLQRWTAKGENSRFWRTSTCALHVDFVIATQQRLPLQAWHAV